MGEDVSSQKSEFILLAMSNCMKLVEQNYKCVNTWLGLQKLE